MKEASVERLCRRLAETPLAFLRPVERGQKDVVQLEAIVSDLFRDRSTRLPTVQELSIFQLPTTRKSKQRKAGARHLRGALITTWLLYDEAFGSLPADALLEFLAQRVRELTELVLPRAFLEDAERREELVRICLSHFGIAPTGETSNDAVDCLGALDSVKRDLLMRRARKRETERAKRRKELEKLQRKEEEEKRKAARSTFED